jgi:hypothetical protein
MDFSHACRRFAHGEKTQTLGNDVRDRLVILSATLDKED